MTPLFNDLAILENGYGIRMLYGTQPMSYDDHSASMTLPSNEIVDAFLYQSFVFRTKLHCS